VGSLLDLGGGEVRTERRGGEVMAAAPNTKVRRSHSSTVLANEWEES